MSNNGDLTEAQKLLLQKFPHLPDDDPLVELAAWNASLEQKVDDFGSRLDVWTNAILKQTDLATQQNQLIVSQNLTLQETAKNNAALGDLAAIQAGLDSIAAGIQNAEGHNRTAREFLDELERQEPELEPEIGRSQPEVEILRNAQSTQQQGRRSDKRPRNPGYQRQQSENELEL